MDELDVSGIEKNLKKLIVTQLVCLVCGKFIFSPIKECLEGHCFCRKCTTKLNKCPRCNSKMADSRPFDLENIQNTVSIPCKNEWQGCPFVGNGSVTERHEVTCEYSYIKCTVNVAECNWRGPSASFYAHGDAYHKSNFFNKSYQRFLTKDFATLMDRRYFVYFKLFNNIFRLTWGVHKDTREVRFAVYYMEKINLCVPIWCTYEICVLKDYKPALKLKAPCYHLEKDVMFQTDKYLTVPFEMLKNMCDKDGDLVYAVKVIYGEFIKDFA